MTTRDRQERPVPFRALVLSAAAFSIPVVGAFWIPATLEDYAALLWLVALIPAFLLAYYRGWQGVATALATGMAVLSVTQAIALWLERPIPDLLFGVVVAYLLIALGIGSLSELFLRDVKEVESFAFTDLPTRLPNRRHARVFLENEFSAAERGRALSVVLFDLDRFRAYNEDYGDRGGDEALKHFGAILEEATRTMNLSARFGGEEFLSILAGSDTEGAMIFADRVRSLLKERPPDPGPLTVSAGVASYRPGMRSPDELLAAADHALYRAKREGRDRVRLFDPTLFEAAVEPDANIDPLESREAGTSRDYPRSADEIGRAPPSLTLLPHQITGFGAGHRVLIVDDQESVRELVASYLRREGFTVSQAGDVPSAIRQLHAEFDVVVTDLRLPSAPGTELVRTVKSRWPDTQVIAVTGDRGAALATRAVRAGAERYLYKPFGMPDLRTHLVDALGARRRRLEERTRIRREGSDGDGCPDEGRGEVIEAATNLTRALEVRDPYLSGHGERVARCAERIAGIVDPDEEKLDRSSLRLAALLHDVGRLEVPPRILSEEGPLSDRELDRVRRHPRAGRQILEPLLDDPVVLEGVTWHHERWDGSGYPDGLAGEAIPLSARILALADALDALTTDRPHRDARSWDEAVGVIREGSGSRFDPVLVDALEMVLGELEEICTSDRPDA